MVVQLASLLFNPVGSFFNPGNFALNDKSNDVGDGGNDVSAEKVTSKEDSVEETAQEVVRNNFLNEKTSTLESQLVSASSLFGATATDDNQALLEIIQREVSKAVVEIKKELDEVVQESVGMKENIAMVLEQIAEMRVRGEFLSRSDLKGGSRSTDDDEENMYEEIQYRRDYVESSLSEDVYTLMMTNSLYRKSWWFGFVIFVLQITLLSIIFHIQLRSSIGSTPFDVPFQVTGDVRASQILAIFIAIMISRDIFMPIKDLTILWISKKEWITVINEIATDDYRSLRSMQNNVFDRPIDEKLCWLVHIFLPNLLKFAQGMLVLVITFVIVIQADDTIELFKDFAAMQIISELDDVAFYLASHGYFGKKLKEDSNASKNIKVADRTIMVLGMPLRPLVLSVLFFTMITVFVGGIVISQDNLSFFVQKYPNCGIKNHAIIANISNGDCNGGVVNSFECGFDGGGELDLCGELDLILVSLPRRF